MDDQNKNLILATALSFAVILVWFVLFPPPEPDTPIDGTSAVQTTGSTADTTVATTPSVDAPVAVPTQAPKALVEAPRASIETPRLTGSISLLGGRIDELKLNDYRETTEPDADIVTLLAPVGSEDPYYALFGWAASTGVTPDAVPGPDTEWTLSDGDVLRPDAPITLSWDNGAGLVFNRTYEVDADFMFTVTQSVQNNGSADASMAPYGILARHGEPDNLKGFFVLHEGLVTMTDELTETDWDNIPDFDVHPKEGVPAERNEDIQNGWIGITDHYWMTTLIPPADTNARLTAKYYPRTDIYQTETVMPKVTIAPGASATNTLRVFAGAKEWETIREYQSEGVTSFIDSIDWGWFFFLTKPIFWLLHELNKLIGNMGWSIIGLTLIIKAVLFPLAYKSYVSMAKMKELQPQMEKLKEAAGDDRQKMQQGMMELYKKEKVNPAAGCLPILLQIPIFFSLYKVIFVTIELRHAPWLGPFQDLSAPDPTSLLNLFGLLPNGAPEPGSIMALVFIGILPLLLGISMWLQQKLNPAPTDPTQQMIFAWMPWVFMFMLGGFASGLVVYWIANNTITFTQQYLIMRSQGYKPDVFGNIMKSFRRKTETDSK
ncbi:Membrane protein insertase YidC [Ascidiaceihabitans donghaensis]|uniref:Membrane protein insertase YidC n=1 Tax=Ascidiaceihabitans donghaensis TaxID=1510460 RepID=A0A2R8BHA0_9RHOB|nr:membrane protein insertase YidC [Ascidiaceihabitans donghaensis]SPH22474.1 Membrane protein insertase YidC [Ascidiaceihabitans donghaensis]